MGRRCRKWTFQSWGGLRLGRQEEECASDVSVGWNGKCRAKGLTERQLKCAHVPRSNSERICMRAKSLELCLTLCDTVDHSLLGFSVGFSRQGYWSGLLYPPPGDFPKPGIQPATLRSPALAGWFFFFYHQHHLGSPERIYWILFSLFLVICKFLFWTCASEYTVFSTSRLKIKGESGQLDKYFQGNLVNLTVETIAKWGESQYILVLAMS